MNWRKVRLAAKGPTAGPSAPVGMQGATAIMDALTDRPNSAPGEQPIESPAIPAIDSVSDEHSETPGNAGDLRWVWLEVRKRVFIKLPFSLGVADAMEAVIPITLDGDTFVCGLSSRDFVLSSHLMANQVRNTIENILRQAAGRTIHFELIEGVTLEEWLDIKERRMRAQEAVIAMARQHDENQHFEDVLNQIVSEMRQQITATRDRNLPQVKAHLVFSIVPSLSDAEEMLFPDIEAHEARRAMARAIDRIAAFLEIAPFELAMEIERYRYWQGKRKATEKSPQTN